jgi:SHS2 domain-containing protein
MFGYITSLESVATSESESTEYGSHIAAEGHDLRSLVYSFLDEWLYNFHDTGFVANSILIEEINLDKWTVISSGNGEIFDVSRHPQGTEVKAITYSGMRVDVKEGLVDIYVVVDI